jgi:hypothetical protein
MRNLYDSVCLAGHVVGNVVASRALGLSSHTIQSVILRDIRPFGGVIIPLNGDEDPPDAGWHIVELYGGVLAAERHKHPPPQLKSRFFVSRDAARAFCEPQHKKFHPEFIATSTAWDMCNAYVKVTSCNRDKVAAALHCFPELDADELYERATNLIGNNWGLVRALAFPLGDRGSLDHEEITEIVRRFDKRIGIHVPYQPTRTLGGN